MALGPDDSARRASYSGVQPGVLIWDRIGANKRNTVFLMIFFVVFATAIVGLIAFALTGVVALVPVVAIGTIIYAIFSYYASAGLTVSISGGHEIQKSDHPLLWNTVENLCIGSGLPMPKVYIIEDSAPNAFATGRDPNHAHVVVTRGLLDKMDKLELEGVIAHELSHIGNYDIRIMTIVVVLVGVIALVSDFALRWTWWGAGSRSSNRDRGGGAVVVILIALAVIAAILAPIVANLIKLAISRQREFLADASAANLTRYPDGLASALEKIANDHEPLEAANKATAHLYIANPLKEHKSMLNGLFQTHPPIEERIRLLRAM
jgi:heat shock protein HtpX